MTTSIVTVDALLVADGQVLMIRRAKEPFMDRLAFPGGHVEEGEELLAATVRELEEEVGIVLEPQRLEYLIRLDATGRDPRPGHDLSHVFYAQVDADLLRSGEAASDAKSVHVVKLSELTADDCAFDHFSAIERMREVLGAD
jgi:8-oxo-dGTP diphosphatase